MKFNRKLGSDYGESLPLGRHSIMNGYVNTISATKRIQEEASKDLLHFLDVAGSISDWGALQVRVLFESVPSWRNEPFIRLAKWEAKFHLSKVKATSRSVQMFKDYLRVVGFDALSS